MLDVEPKTFTAVWIRGIYFLENHFPFVIHSPPQKKNARFFLWFESLNWKKKIHFGLLMFIFISSHHRKTFLQNVYSCYECYLTRPLGFCLQKISKSWGWQVFTFPFKILLPPQKNLLAKKTPKKMGENDS